MKKPLFAIAALASLLAGCQMVEVTPVVDKASKTFEGVIVDGTRASFTADWLATTTLRLLPPGHPAGTVPIPVTFIDLKTGSPLTVTWKAP